MKRENKSLKYQEKTLETAVRVPNNNRVRNDCVISAHQVVPFMNLRDTVEVANDNGIVLDSHAIKEAYYLTKKCDKNEVSKTLVVELKVYVHDYLNKQTLALWNHSKELKSVGYQHVNIRNGKVDSKKSKQSKIQPKSY